MSEIATNHLFRKEFIKALQTTLPQEEFLTIVTELLAGTDVSREIEIAVNNILNPMEQERVAATQPFDPTQVDIAELLESLSNNVVRLVFYKKNGDRRIMYGTRNADLIKLYESSHKDPLKKLSPELETLNSAEKISAQINGDFIRLFDLEINEFRSFKPSALAKFDNSDNVSSWIEFKPNYDSWYIMAKEDGDISKYYVGKREARNIGKSNERAEYERQAKLDIRDAEYTREQVQKETEQIENDPKYQENKRNQTLVSYLGKFTTHHKETYTGREFSANYTDFFLYAVEYLTELTRESNPSVKITKLDPVMKVLLFTVGDDKYIFHPHLLVNTSNRYVYYDLNNLFAPSTQTALAKENPDIRSMFDVAFKESALRNRRTILNPLNPDYTNKDAKRIRRINRIVESRDSFNDILRDVGVTVTQHGEYTVFQTRSLEVKISPYVSTLSCVRMGDAGSFLYKRAFQREIARRKNKDTVNPFVEETMIALSDFSNKTSESTKKEALLVIEAMATVSTAYNLTASKFRELNLRDA